MELQTLPQVLLHEILSYLSAPELLQAIVRLNSHFPQLISEFLLSSDLLQTFSFGHPYFLPSLNPSLYRKALLTASLSPTCIFSMRATHTTGGVFNNEVRYWVQNLFDYTGSVYTTSGVVRDVVVRGCFEGRAVGYGFEEYTHEDVMCARSTPEVIPMSFLSNYVPMDTFLTFAPAQCIGDIPTSRIRAWPHGDFPVPISNFPIRSLSEKQYEILVPSPTAIGLITHVGVARPAFFTCPIRTVMVFTQLTAESRDLSAYYGLNDPASIPNADLCYREETEEYLSYEFTGGDGALLWLQYKSARCSQAAVQLKRPRLMQYCDVLLVDVEDRRLQYGYPESGMDVTYVAFGGRIVPLELEGIYRTRS